jgi:hypothetical protein
VNVQKRYALSSQAFIACSLRKLDSINSCMIHKSSFSKALRRWSLQKCPNVWRLSKDYQLRNNFKPRLKPIGSNLICIHVDKSSKRGLRLMMIIGSKVMLMTKVTLPGSMSRSTLKWTPSFVDMHKKLKSMGNVLLYKTSSKQYNTWRTLLFTGPGFRIL